MHSGAFFHPNITLVANMVTIISNSRSKVGHITPINRGRTKRNLLNKKQVQDSGEQPTYCRPKNSFWNPKRKELFFFPGRWFFSFEPFNIFLLGELMMAPRYIKPTTFQFSKLFLGWGTFRSSSSRAFRGADPCESWGNWTLGTGDDGWQNVANLSFKWLFFWPGEHY